MWRIRKYPEVGDKFNRLTFVSKGWKDSRWKSLWFFGCDCWKEKEMVISKARCWLVKSCWCIKYEQKKNLWKFSFEKKKWIDIITQEKYNQCKRISIKKWWDFNLSRKEISEIIKKRCHYCWKKRSEKRWDKYSWIDRVNSSIWYIKENIVPCCSWCNTAKLNRSQDDFNQHILDIYEYMKK